MPDLLLEIGTEELPASVVASGERQLRERAAEGLQRTRLRHGDLAVFATPRRLGLVVADVAEQQDPSVDERRGPPVARAHLEDGSFAPAAVGFARANGVEPGELVAKTTEQGEYLYAVREMPGAPAADVLPALLAEVIAGLQFAKTMRWDGSGLRFPRPVRWLTAMLGSSVLSVEIGSLRAGSTTRGHRLFGPGPVQLTDASAYEQTLQTSGVIASRAARRDAVRAEVEQAAARTGGSAVVHDRILDEVTDLVERPSAVTGHFEPAYLELPRDVLVTAMETHQRYFAVQDGEGRLMPGFVAVSNGAPDHADTIASGNERVLRARLEDARFFFHEDLKVSLLQRTEKLEGVVFHAGLGSMRDKVLRVGGLLGEVVRWMELSDDQTDAAFAAADVCKSDLTTHLVYEFPELQGVVGREYALRDAELAGPGVEAVAEAIREHYLPRFAGDDLPVTPAGRALGIADRLDTIVGYLGIGLAPSGSEDPFALRRQATGLVAILLEAGARLPLDESVRVAYESYARAGAEMRELAETFDDVTGLLVSRLETLLEREEIDRLFIAAAKGSVWRDFADFAVRARALQSLHDRGMLHGLVVTHERCHNLSRGGPHGDVDPGRFVADVEHDLHGQLLAVEEIVSERAAARDYGGALEALVALASVVDNFLDGERSVLVMDPDPDVRRNRLSLLERTARTFEVVAEFASIPPKLLASQDGEDVGS